MHRVVKLDWRRRWLAIQLNEKVATESDINRRHHGNRGEDTNRNRQSRSGWNFVSDPVHLTTAYRA